MQMQQFSCGVPICGTSGMPDRMWNLDQAATGGKRVVVCTKHAYEARRNGLRAYRLSETLASR